VSRSRATFAALVAFTCQVPISRAASPDEIVGHANVIDGDTIEIGGQRIRLNGIDAPESWQLCRDGSNESYRCGKEAAFALDGFLAASRPTTCLRRGQDRYGRVVADCFRADGEAVNQWLVRSGYAVDWARYSHGEFAADQDAAKAKRLGIWRGGFEMPCVARANQANRPPAC
jgi:succinoglycan biosynthesis protein ExoI